MSLQASRHNIFGAITDSDEYYIINLLSGHADIISANEARHFLDPNLQAIPQEMITKGYFVDPEAEEQQYRMSYLDFLEARDQEEVQLFFVPGYSCNFNCSYCYQSDYPNQTQKPGVAVIDAFFAYVHQSFADRKKYITLFGGEPFMGGQQHRESIRYFLQKAREHHLEVAAVTNGYLLDEYLELLEPGHIREIQVTLDGLQATHDTRRMLHAGGATFDRIVANIDACLQKGLSINLRMVVDRENIADLPELARFAIERGWTQSPLFKTQIGRNYELHYCQEGASKLLSRLELYQILYKQIKSHPHILEFHKPAFSLSKFLQENGNLPKPLYDACPACKSEWAMDYTGSIYSCTATVGKPGERLGSFYPAVELDQEKVLHWQQRDVLAIEQCTRCNLQLLCGGGCGSIAANQHQNIIMSPDCRPLTDIIGMGLAGYFPVKL